MARRRAPPRTFHHGYLPPPRNASTVPFMQAPFSISPQGCFFPTNYYYLRMPGYSGYPSMPYTGQPLPPFSLIPPFNAQSHPVASFQFLPAGFCAPPMAHTILPPRRPAFPSTFSCFDQIVANAQQSQSSNQRNGLEPASTTHQSSSSDCKHRKRNRKLIRQNHVLSVQKHKKVPARKGPSYSTNNRFKSKAKRISNTKRFFGGRSSYSTNDVSSSSRSNDMDEANYETCEEWEMDEEKKDEVFEESDWTKDNADYMQKSQKNGSDNQFSADYTIITNDKSYSYVNFNPEMLPKKCGRVWIEPRLSEIRFNSQKCSDKILSVSKNRETDCSSRPNDKHSKQLNNKLPGKNISFSDGEQWDKDGEVNTAYSSDCKNNFPLEKAKDFWWDYSTDIGCRSSVPSKPQSDSSVNQSTQVNILPKIHNFSQDGCHMNSCETVVAQHIREVDVDNYAIIENGFEAGRNLVELTYEKHLPEQSIGVNGVGNPMKHDRTCKPKSSVPRSTVGNLDSQIEIEKVNDNRNRFNEVTLDVSNSSLCVAEPDRGEPSEEDHAIVAVVHRDLEKDYKNDLPDCKRSDQTFSKLNCLYEEGETKDQDARSDKNVEKPIHTFLNSIIPDTRSLPCSPLLEQCEPLFRSYSSSFLESPLEASPVHDKATRVCTPHSKIFFGNSFPDSNYLQTISLPAGASRLDDDHRKPNVLNIVDDNLALKNNEVDPTLSTARFSQAKTRMFLTLTKTNLPTPKRIIKTSKNESCFKQELRLTKDDLKQLVENDVPTTSTSLKNIFFTSASDTTQTRECLVVSSKPSCSSQITSQVCVPNRCSNNKSDAPIYDLHNFIPGTAARSPTRSIKKLPLLERYVEKAAKSLQTESNARCAVSQTHYSKSTSVKPKWMTSTKDRNKVNDEAFSQNQIDIDVSNDLLPMDLSLTENTAIYQKVSVANRTASNVVTSRVVHGNHSHGSMLIAVSSAPTPTTSPAMNSKLSDYPHSKVTRGKVQSNIQAKVQDLIKHSTQYNVNAVYSPCLAALQAGGLNKKPLRMFPLHSITYPSAKCFQTSLNRSISAPSSPKRSSVEESFYRSVSLSDVFYDTTVNDSLLYNSLRASGMTATHENTSNSHRGKRSNVNQKRTAAERNKSTYISFPMSSLTPPRMSNFKQIDTKEASKNLENKRFQNSVYGFGSSSANDEQISKTSSPSPNITKLSSGDNHSQILDQATEHELRKSAQSLIDSIKENIRLEAVSEANENKTTGLGTVSTSSIAKNNKSITSDFQQSKAAENIPLPQNDRATQTSGKFSEKRHVIKEEIKGIPAVNTNTENILAVNENTENALALNANTEDILAVNCINEDMIKNGDREAAGPPTKPPRSKSSNVMQDFHENAQVVGNSSKNKEKYTLVNYDTSIPAVFPFYSLFAVGRSSPHNVESQFVSPPFTASNFCNPFLRAPHVSSSSTWFRLPQVCNGHNKLSKDVASTDERTYDVLALKDEPELSISDSDHSLLVQKDKKNTQTSQVSPSQTDVKEEQSSFKSGAASYIFIPCDPYFKESFSSRQHRVTRRRSFSGIGSSGVACARMYQRRLNQARTKHPYLSRSSKQRFLQKANLSNPVPKRPLRRPRFVRSSLSEDGALEVMKQNGSFLTKPSNAKVSQCNGNGAQDQLIKSKSNSGEELKRKGEGETETGYTSSDTPEKEKNENAPRSQKNANEKPNQSKDGKKSITLQTIQRTLKKIIPGKRSNKVPMHAQDTPKNIEDQHSKVDLKLKEPGLFFADYKKDLFGKSRKLLTDTDEESTLKADARSKTPKSVEKISEPHQKQKHPRTFTKPACDGNKFKEALIQPRGVATALVEAKASDTINSQSDKGSPAFNINECSAVTTDQQGDKVTISTPGARINSDTGDVLPEEKEKNKEATGHRNLLSSTAIDDLNL